MFCAELIHPLPGYSSKQVGKKAGKTFSHFARIVNYAKLSPGPPCNKADIFDAALPASTAAATSHVAS